LTPAAHAAPLPVSVVIPAYNAEQTVGRALRGVARQQPAPPAEVIVVDDRSSDATGDVAADLGAKVIRHDRNRGTAAARNTALASTSQPWIAFLDADDEWLPHHLASLWADRADHVLVANSALRCGADPANDIVQGPPGPGPLVPRDPGLLVFPGNIVVVSAAMARRETVQEAGGFRPPDGTADLDLWLRLLELGTGLLRPTVGVIYHLSEGQLSSDALGMQQQHIAVAQRFRDRPWCSGSLIERWRGLAAWNNVRAALRRRRLRDAIRSAGWIAKRPSRLRGALEAGIRRTRRNRRSGRIGRDGNDSIAVLPWSRATRAQALKDLNGRPIVDLGSDRGQIAAYCHLLWRPPAEAVAGSSVEAILLRAAGVRSLIRLDREPRR
jgi:glycosyltransferase involved in cell wall biosynthesis